MYVRMEYEAHSKSCFTDNILAPVHWLPVLPGVILYQAGVVEPASEMKVHIIKSMYYVSYCIIIFLISISDFGVHVKV